MYFCGLKDDLVSRMMEVARPGLEWKEVLRVEGVWHVEVY